MSSTRSSDTVVSVAAAADLESWSGHDWADGVQVDELPPLEQLVVETRNNTYEITVLDPQNGEVMVRGGRFFPQPTRAWVAGCSLGGSFLKLRGIYVGFCLELSRNGETIVTTRVRAIAGSPPEPVRH